MKLSIVICVYNTKIEYLEECLRSLTESTLQSLGDAYEICMVDDGSSLDYTMLLERYPVQYVKTENRGILASRRTGVEMTRGTYIAFCDSDDTVSFNYHAPMVEKAEEVGADIVINDWAFHTPKVRYYCKNDDLIKNDLDVSGEDKLLAFFKNEGRQHSFYVLWNKLYRASLLKSAFESVANSAFPKDSSYSEDAAINFFAWRDASRIVNIHTGFYFYRIHEAQSVTVTSEEKLKKQIHSMSACLNVMQEESKSHPQHDRLLGHIREWGALMARAHYSQALEFGYPSLYEEIKEGYHVEVLSRASARDSDAYAAKALIGTNVDQIDRALLALWNAPLPATVKYDPTDLYTARTIKELSRKKEFTVIKKGASVTVPSPTIPFKHKLIHNSVIYKIGLRLFKKGSRLRKLLKRII